MSASPRVTSDAKLEVEDVIASLMATSVAMRLSWAIAISSLAPACGPAGSRPDGGLPATAYVGVFDGSLTADVIEQMPPNTSLGLEPRRAVVSVTESDSGGLLLRLDLNQPADVEADGDAPTDRACVRPVALVGGAAEFVAGYRCVDASGVLFSTMLGGRVSTVLDRRDSPTRSLALTADWEEAYELVLGDNMIQRGRRSFHFAGGR